MREKCKGGGPVACQEWMAGVRGRPLRQGGPHLLPLPPLSRGKVCVQVWGGWAGVGGSSNGGRSRLGNLAVGVLWSVEGTAGEGTVVVDG